MQFGRNSMPFLRNGCAVLSEYTILPENLPLVSKDRLFEMYNEAVQEIWHLSKLNAQLREENDALWKSNEEMMDQLYG